MTGHKEQDRRELRISEVEYIKERMRTEKKPDARRIAQELGVYHLTVSRTISALRFLERMTRKTYREAKEGNT